MHSSARGSLGLKLVGVALALGAWQLYASLSGNRMIPGWLAIAQQGIELARSGDLLHHGLSTLSHGFLGLAIAFALAAATGFLSARHWAVDAALHPLVSLAYPVPKLALYPIVILMFGLGGASRTAQVALECFFPLFVHCHAGAQALAPRTEWLARNVGAGPWRMTRDVLVPTALPFVLTGLRVAVPIMLIVTTVTEFIGDSQGLGHLIARSASYFDSASAFAVVAVLGAIGFVSDRLIVALRGRVVFWERGASL